MRPLHRFRQALEPELTARGFERLDYGDFFIFTRELPDGSRQQLWLDKQRFFDAVDISLKTFRPGNDDLNRPDRSAELFDFVSTTRQGFEYEDEAGLRRATQTALAEMQSHGFPWLDGQDVVTPSIQAMRDRTARDKADALTRQGMEAFKSGDFALAAELLQAASAHAELGKVAAKYLELAVKRI